MSRGGQGANGATLGFPRVSGDEPAPVFASGSAKKFSPRERG